MTSIPRISLLIATRNQAPTLPHTLESAFNQDLPSEQLEVIVVDDGSTDQTADILHRYGGRIRIFRQPHLGLAAACNTGLDHIRGEIYARLDSDDWADPTWLRKGVVLLENHPKAVCIYPDYVEVREDGNRRFQPTDEANLYTLAACGTLMRTAAVKSVGGYRPLYWEEYDLYLRLMETGAFVHLKEPLYFYRKHAESMTADRRQRQHGWHELLDAWGRGTLEKMGRHPELEEAIASSWKELQTP